MLQYVDSFYCASSSDKKTIVLRLRQEEPIESEGDHKVTMQVNEVSNIVLSHECAQQLALSILQLLDTSESTLPIENSTSV